MAELIYTEFKTKDINKISSNDYPPDPLKP